MKTSSSSYVRDGPDLSRKYNKSARVPAEHVGQILPPKAPLIPYRAGHLYKRKRRKGLNLAMVVSQWNLRYFSIDVDAGRLAYHSTRQEFREGKLPSGSITLNSITGVRVLEGLRFEVKASDTNLHLSLLTTT